mgnify:CR=1 FL=1
MLDSQLCSLVKSSIRLVQIRYPDINSPTNCSDERMGYDKKQRTDYTKETTHGTKQSDSTHGPGLCLIRVRPAGRVPGARAGTGE